MIRLFAILLALIWATPALASNEITIKANASPNRLPPGYTFRLEIMVEGKGFRSLPDPHLPRLEHFEIKGRSSIQQGTLSGLSLTISKTIVYEVLAVREGKFKIPSITLKYGGKTYSTDPINITVDKLAPIPKNQRRARRRPAPAPAPAPPGITDPFGGGGSTLLERHSKPDIQDLMVKMDVDKKSAVPYELIIATFSFYRAVTLWQNPSYDKPKFEGFWVEDLPFKKGENEQVTHELIGGKNFIVTKVRYAIIPLSPGKKIIDQATILVSVGPWSERVRLNTKPIAVEIRPFPKDGAPAGFANIVGKYNISAQVEPLTAKVNEGMTLRLTIKGEGYLKPVASPFKPSIDGMEIYDPKVTDSVDKSGGSIISTKVFEYPMIPREAGKKKLDSISIWAYHPDLDKYILLITPPIELTVLAGKAGKTGAGALGGARPAIKSDIRYIKADKSGLNDLGSPLHNSYSVWLILIAPFPFLVAGWVVTRRKKRLMTDNVYSRSYHAAKRAKAMLTEAGKIKELDEFYMSLDNAIRGYLADKWNLPAPSITKQLAITRLDQSGAKNSGGLVELFEAVEIARYARHEKNNMNLHLAKANEFVEWMEKQTV